jgi:4-nitrophenyl phosphatase
VSGCRTTLVLTGVATADNVHEQLASAGVTPDLVCDDLAHFIAQFTELGGL